MSLAKVMLIGNLGRDPETRFTPNGAMNVQFSVATNRRWNDSSGQLQERTTWFRVTGWGRLAETMNNLAQQGYLAKGRQVFVMGSLETNEFVDRQGQTRTSLDVRADELQLVGGAGEREGGGFGQPSQNQSMPSGEQDDLGSSDMDDVPF